MPRHPPRGRFWALGIASVAVLYFAACDSENAPTIADIQVTSSIDSIIPVGVAAQLSAEATTASGGLVTTDFDWSSSNPDVADVSSSGRVLALAPGAAMITAVPAAGGVAGVGGTVGGTLRMRVLDADVVGMQTIITDPLMDHFTGALTASSQSVVNAAVASCESGLGTGNLVLVIEALEVVRTAANDATEGTDRALLATIVLLTNFAQTLLNY